MANMYLFAIARTWWEIQGMHPFMRIMAHSNVSYIVKVARRNDVESAAYLAIYFLRG
jgi:hypothetical protein